MIDNILGLVTGLFSKIFNLGQQDIILVIILFFILIIIALKVFQYLLRALISGIAFGLFPFIANFLGIQIPLTIQNIAWFVILGIVMFFAYNTITTGVKLFKFILSPFSRLFKRKEKNKEKKDKKNKEK